MYMAGFVLFCCFVVKFFIFECVVLFFISVLVACVLFCNINCFELSVCKVHSSSCLNVLPDTSLLQQNLIKMICLQESSLPW